LDFGNQQGSDFGNQWVTHRKAATERFWLWRGGMAGARLPNCVPCNRGERDSRGAWLGGFSLKAVETHAESKSCCKGKGTHLSMVYEPEGTVSILFLLWVTYEQQAKTLKASGVLA